jgi:predicted metal-binding protein
MCNADKCGHYGRNWTCPPGCGDLDDNREKLSTFSTGLLVQTTATLDDDFDFETMSEAGRLQRERMLSFRKTLVGSYADILTLGNGSCDLCETCTYPDAPCINPDESISSMEAFGLVVSDVCKSNDLGYNYGPRTITYTGCFLLH